MTRAAPIDKNARATAPSGRQPLHKRILEELRSELNSNYRPGDRFASQNELARRFGVSALTIREALSALVDAGMIERRVGSGTYVADQTRNRHIGVLIELDISHPLTSYFFLRATQQLRLAFRARGYRERLYAGHTAANTEWSGRLSCAEFYEDLERGLLCGVASICTNPSGDWFSKLQARGIPVVGDHLGFRNRVGFDHSKLIKAGVAHLAMQGRKRLGCVSWGAGKVFTEALREFKLECRSCWIVEAQHPSNPGAGEQALLRLWNALPEKPDGLLFTDDVLFGDARHALPGLGVSIPEQLAIATHANRGRDYATTLPHTRLEVDPDGYALTMANLLLEIIEQRRQTETVCEVPFWLVQAPAARISIDIDKPELKETADHEA